MAQERTLIEDRPEKLKPELMARLSNMTPGDSGVPGETTDEGEDRPAKFRKALKIQGYLANVIHDKDVSRVSIHPTSMVVEVRCLRRGYKRVKADVERILEKNEVQSPDTKVNVITVRRKLIAKSLHGPSTKIDIQNMDNTFKQSTVAAIACNKHTADRSCCYAVSVGPATTEQTAFVQPKNVSCRLFDPEHQPGAFAERHMTHLWQPGDEQTPRYDLCLMDLDNEPVEAHYRRGINIPEVKDPQYVQEGFLLPRQGDTLMLLTSRGQGSVKVKELNAETSNEDNQVYLSQYLLTLNPTSGTIHELEEGDCGTAVVKFDDSGYYLIAVVHAKLVPETDEEAEDDDDDDDPGFDNVDEEDDEPHVVAFLFTEPFSNIADRIGIPLRLLHAPGTLEMYLNTP